MSFPYNNISTIADVESLRESSEIECKRALGKSGKGEVPKCFWETYSAFANTDGGEIYLGIEENKDRSLTAVGIPDASKVQQDLINTANSSEKVSANLLNNQNIQIIKVNNLDVIRVVIPKAPRKLKPVYVGANPLTGSYYRLNEADCKLPKEKVTKMLAEQGDASFDSRILKGYTYDDLDLDTIKAYRSTFAALKPTHPYVSLDLNEFMRSIGAWRRDRETGEEGFTLAGLLMFGKLRSILDELPNFILDYQERPEAKTEKRWIDRLTLDGSWSGNLYDFYTKTYKKLTADLKIPFVLEGAVRQDETPIHEALREALVNTIVHADYNERVSILVVKRPDMFGFRNPGLMRVPPEQAIMGGDSDCRNRTLQKMFQFVGAGEQAGSGVPRIYNNWQQQHWRNPKINERREPDQTLFELHMASLIPQEALDALKEIYGDKFDKLTEGLSRLILATTYTEMSVDHKRLREITTEHPSDISKALAQLVRDGFLHSIGSGKGTSYYLPEGMYADIFDNNFSSPTLTPEVNSRGMEVNSGGLLKEEVDLARIPRENKKLNKHSMEQIIIALCSIRPQTLDQLSKLVDRSSDFLRSSYLRPLIKKGKLSYLHKEQNHPQQAYIVNTDNDVG